MVAKYVSTTLRKKGEAGFRVNLILGVDNQAVVSTMLTLVHEDPAVLFAAVKATSWSSTLEFFNQLERIVKDVDGTRPRSAQHKIAVARLREMRCDVFSASLTDKQVLDAYFLLTDVYERWACCSGSNVTVTVEDVWYEEDDGSCYDVEVRE